MQSANEAIVSQPVHQKVIISAQTRRFYPRAIWELAARHITDTFLRHEDISAPENTSASVEIKMIGLLRCSFKVEFEIINASTSFTTAALCDEVHRLLIMIGARKLESEITRIE